MIVAVSRPALLELLQVVTAAVPGKSTYPLCSMLHLEVRGEELSALATDLDVATRMTIAIAPEGPADGAFCVPARKFLEVIKELPEDEQVLLDHASPKLWIRCGGFTASLTTAPAGDFPQPPAIEGARALVPRAVLDVLLGRTAFAVSHDTARISLNGVFWEPSEGRLSAVATDGHRMAYSSTACQASIGSGVILPPKAMSMLLRAIVAPEVEIELTLGDANASLKAGTVEVFSRLIEGPYVNYRQVVPRTFATTITVSRNELSGAVRRVQTITSAATRSITLELSESSPRTLRLSTRNADLGGDADEPLSVEAQGPAIRLGLNSSLFLEILALVPTPGVRIQLNTPQQAVLISPAEDNPSSWWIQMPLRLPD